MNERDFSSACRAAAVGLAMTVCMGGAWAQDAEQQVPDGSEVTATDTQAVELDVIPVESKSTGPEQNITEPKRPTQLEEIVVTATKRAQPLRDIPASITALSGEDLERQGIQNIEQIVALVPGVNLTDEGTGGVQKRITIRGVSTDMGVNPTAGTLFGDIPFSDPFLPKVQLDPNPFDMATVEVLKGPQGTLFGGTGLNGLIRYVPEVAQLDEFQLRYYAQRTAYPGNGDDGWSYGAVVNMPFADHTAAVRLMAFDREAPGFVDDTRAGGKPDVNSLEQQGFRGSIAWMPAERWKISLMGATQETDDADLSYTENYDGHLEHDTSPRPSPAESRYFMGNLGIERAFDWGDLISQTSYVDKEFNIFLEASRAVGGVLPLLAGADDNHSEGFTQELRAVSATGDSPWRWLAGLVHYQLRLYDCASVGAAQNLPTIPIPDLLEGIVANPCPGNLSRVGDQLVIGQLIGDVDLQEQAMFGELTREIGDHWEATAGARVYRLKSDGVVTTAGAVFSTQNNLMEVSRANSVSENGISPKASIAYAPTDDLRAYFTVSRGFRFGGPQIGASTPGAEVPEVYKSDSLWNYEIGLRTDWLDRSLRIDLSAYRIDWTDPQVRQEQRVGALPIGNFIDNVGGAEGTGVELSMRYLLPFIPGLSLSTSAAWNRTVTTEEFTSVNGDLIPSGSPWPLAPRWQTSSALDYTALLGTWQLGGSLRHTYLDQACNTIECTGLVFGYQTLDLNLFASPVERSYWPQFSVTLGNLTDERGYSNITTNPAPAMDTVNYIAPRSLVLRVSGSF